MVLHRILCHVRHIPVCPASNVWTAGHDVCAMQVALKVAMMCSGCEGAVRRVLQNKPGRLCLYQEHGDLTVRLCMPSQVCMSFVVLLCAGVQSVDIDLASQKVLVKGDVSQEDILQTVSKTGKKTELWQ